MTKPNWLTIENIRGEPIRVGDKTLTPLARRIAIHVDVLSAQGGGGGGIEHIQPIGVVEEVGAVTRRIPVEDVTAAALRSMLIGVLAVGAVAWLVRQFAGRRGEKKDD